MRRSRNGSSLPLYREAGEGLSRVRQDAGLWTPGWTRPGRGCPLQREWDTAMVAAPCA